MSKISSRTTGSSLLQKCSTVRGGDSSPQLLCRFTCVDQNWETFCTFCISVV